MTPPKIVIYTALGLDGVELCHPIDSDDFTKVGDVDGRPRLATWEPLAMEIIKVDEDGNKLLRSDSP